MLCLRFVFCVIVVSFFELRHEGGFYLIAAVVGVCEGGVGV